MKMNTTGHDSAVLGTSALRHDLTASVVVFLVALPLCLGIALASNAPPFAGLLAGIVGGIVVGILSGSGSSVSGPAAGLAAVVATQIHAVGSFEAFLLVVVFAGIIQIAFGLARFGMLARFMPTSVIKGLLAAIGVILIIKQFPNLAGFQKSGADNEPGPWDLVAMLHQIHAGSAAIGLTSLGLLLAWDRFKVLKKSPVPAPLVVVVFGVAVSEGLRLIPGIEPLGSSLLVKVPSAKTFGEFIGFLSLPDFSQVANPVIYTAAFTVAAVASIETLLNLEAVDNLDSLKRHSPPNRELLAQGIGNVVSGMIGGLPLTSVIVRSSVNLNMGAKTKLSAIVHGFLLLGCVALMPSFLNLIPLSCLAAILIATGIKLASPGLVIEKWEMGRNQFLPFVVTVTTIIATDLLVGIIAGLAVQYALNLWGGAPLNSTFRTPVELDRHDEGQGRAIVANAATFSNWVHIRSRLVSEGLHATMVLDLSETRFIDATVMLKIRELQQEFQRAGGSLKVEGLEEHKPETSHPTASRRLLIPPASGNPFTKA